MLKSCRLPQIAISFLVTFLPAFCAHAQTSNTNDLKQLVQDCKKDQRGPYQSIRWFCPDGTILPPQERCPQPGGIQHALHKNVVQKIAREKGIFLGQILAGTPIEVFFDAANQNSRLKQYQMEKFLHAVDDGWIMQKARYYRGAVQAEDEEAWGLSILLNLMGRSDVLDAQFFLLRQAVKDIPHAANNDRWQSIRAVSKIISDSLSAFMDLRVKLHGQPDETDLKRVRDFRTRNRLSITPGIDAQFEKLITDLDIAYHPFDIRTLQNYIADLPGQSPLAIQLNTFIRTHTRGWTNNGSLVSRCDDLAELLLGIRFNLSQVKLAKARLAMLDLSNELENVLYREVGNWQPETVGELLAKNFVLAKAATGCGFLELWEWHTVESLLRAPNSDAKIPYTQVREKIEYARRIVEWGTGMVRSHYEPIASLFGTFEPLASGFIDDRIRASILLRLGDVVGQLKDIADRFSNTSNKVFNIANQNHVRGLNPGFAVGEMVVVTGSAENIDFATDKIYVVQRTPSEMKPVAGIATVEEGNLVSHVQLLARNLGIPNAVLSQQNLLDLQKFSGQQVFYAVSPEGTVVMKSTSAMTVQEKALIEVRKRSEERIAVPARKLDLNRKDLLSLKNLRAFDSGKYCGPKAANLGQLKYMFPENVVEGLVIPFGAFRAHLDQIMPGTDNTYWHFLEQTFVYARDEREVGLDEAEVEKRTLENLAQLREAIKKIDFLPGFREKLRQRFHQEFDEELGELAVFIRSDTNMEDLKDFTGAGLNLTVFNVVDEEKILQGIRDVWASPYTERSYRWRQKYLLNPENVYPSILIIPTVNVQKSGVMITTGVTSLNSNDVTVAFSRGAGGAVEGQAAETYLLRYDGKNILQTPAREVYYNLLPETGGSKKATTFFNERLLNEADLQKLRDFSQVVKKKLPGAPGIETDGPFDVELGFLDGKIWLFQIRPYVENKRAKSTAYLQALDPVVRSDVLVLMSQRL